MISSNLCLFLSPNNKICGYTCEMWPFLLDLATLAWPMAHITGNVLLRPHIGPVKVVKMAQKWWKIAEKGHILANLGLKWSNFDTFLRKKEDFSEKKKHFSEKKKHFPQKK